MDEQGEDVWLSRITRALKELRQKDRDFEAAIPPAERRRREDRSTAKTDSPDRGAAQPSGAGLR